MDKLLISIVLIGVISLTYWLWIQLATVPIKIFFTCCIWAFTIAVTGDW